MTITLVPVAVSTNHGSVITGLPAVCSGHWWGGLRRCWCWRWCSGSQRQRGWRWAGGKTAWGPKKTSWSRTEWSGCLKNNARIYLLCARVPTCIFLKFILVVYYYVISFAAWHCWGHMLTVCILHAKSKMAAKGPKIAIGVSTMEGGKMGPTTLFPIDRLNGDQLQRWDSC